MTILGTSGGDATEIFLRTKCPFCDKYLLWATNRFEDEPDLSRQYFWTAVCPDGDPVDLTARMCCLTLSGEFS